MVFRGSLTPTLTILGMLLLISPQVILKYLQVYFMDYSIISCLYLWVPKGDLIAVYKS